MMKRLGFASALSVLALAVAVPAARAADIGAARIPIAAEVVATGFTWTAVYGGLHAGYGFANTSISVPGIFGFSGIGSNGWLVGARIGADYQFAQRWVAGVLAEGNIQGIDTVIGLGGPNLKLTGDRRWSVRGRLGYLLTPETRL
jgi:outer membrane immunogenic protein